MIKRNIILLLLLCFVFRAAAQDAEIGKIKTLYTETQELIATMSAPSEEMRGGLYCSELTVNKYDAQWRAVGTYLKTIRFWYTDQPEFAEMEGGSKASALRKVEISSKWAAGNTEHTELLFDKGQLVFCFKKDASYDNIETPKEMRWYFSGDKLIRYQEGINILKEMPDAKEIQALSQRMLELFYTTFN
jgi:hypothetical protein